MKKRDIILSIGLIVKNEEEYLEQCLESLKPLLNQVPSELLIADTGSDDRTIEIAKRYTDKVFTYKWENDFAKARNFVLNKAGGEWFMQIDADERLESAQAMIEFLNSEKSVYYNDIYVCFRDYLYDVEEKFGEVYRARLFRTQPGREYEGAIHETVAVVGPKKYLDVLIYHYGYIKMKYTGKSLRQKKGRNLPLLIKAVEQNGDDPRLLFHLAQEYIIEKQYEPAKKILYQVIKAQRDCNYKMYAAEAFVNLNGIYALEKEYDKSIKEAQKYFEEGFETDITTLNIITNTLKAMQATARYEESLRYFEKFFVSLQTIKDKVKQGRKDLDIVFHVYNDEYCENIRCQHILTLQKCEHYKEALEKLQEIQGMSGYGTVNLILKPWIAQLENMECYEAATAYYHTLQSGTEVQQSIGRGLLMGIWEADAQIAVGIAKLLVIDWGRGGENFSKAQQLLLRHQAKENISGKEIEETLEGLEPELYYQQLLYLAITYEADIGAFLGRCTTNRVKEYAREVYEKNYGVRQGLMAGQFQKKEYGSLKEILFFAMLREQLTMDGRISLKQLKEALKEYVDVMTFYLENLYQPKILDRRERSNLPDEYAFVLYIYEAFSYGEIENPGAYLDCLKEAVRACPSRNKVVKRLIEDMEKELEAQIQARQEFDSYGTQVKTIIREMLQTRNYDAAMDALLAYEKVNPLDADITELKAQLGIFPS